MSFFDTPSARTNITLTKTIHFTAPRISNLPKKPCEELEAGKEIRELTRPSVPIPKRSHAECEGPYTARPRVRLAKGEFPARFRAVLLSRAVLLEYCRFFQHFGVNFLIKVSFRFQDYEVTRNQQRMHRATVRRLDMTTSRKHFKC